MTHPTRAFLWKCRLCGAVEANPFGCQPPARVLTILTDLQTHGRVRDPGIDGHLMGMGMTTTHMCDGKMEGRMGIADLIGNGEVTA